MARLVEDQPSAGPPVAGFEPDGMDTDPIVGEAVSALRAFGGEMPRSTARTLLRLWRGWDELAPEAMLATLRRFPSPTDARRARAKRSI